MSWNAAIEHAALSLGYDLIAVERTGGGLLRVTIDWPWNADLPEKLISAEDCERLTRQLQYALEVENLDYTRLEVSSPGIDRPLRSEADLRRFEGEVIDVVLKQPIGEAGQAGMGLEVGMARKKFRGRVHQAEVSADAPGQQQWTLACEEPPIGTPKPLGKHKLRIVHYALGFQFDELKEAHLAPLVDFKGRARKGGAGISE